MAASTDHDDDAVGQPLCPECYDYRRHVLFGWWAPDLWRRFTITLRRLLTKTMRTRREDPGSVRISFVKVVELQARAIPHYHAAIRLDTATGDGSIIPPSTSISAAELAVLVQTAASRVCLDVPDGAGGVCRVRFGSQIDTQPLTGTSSAGSSSADDDGGVDRVRRRVAGYLAKYVTKSVTEFGLAPQPMSPKAIAGLDVSEHVRTILSTLAALAGHSGEHYAAMAGWFAHSGVSRACDDQVAAVFDHHGRTAGPAGRLAGSRHPH